MEAPKSKVTVVSPAAMLVSRIRVGKGAPFSSSSAVPPVAWPAVIVAWAVRFVWVVFTVFATIVPPTGVSVTPVGADGMVLSTVSQPGTTAETLPAVSAATRL